MQPAPRRGRLVGREEELRVLDDLLGALQAGESRALVLRGDPGVGKTALLDQLSIAAVDCRLVGLTGVEAEMELPFAALHQLCAPLLDHIAQIPGPQRAALEVTFGISSGLVPERLLVGVAVLSLLAEVAAERPLLAVVDDAQWVDRASIQTLAFVSRRLGAESVGIVIGTRSSVTELAGLPELALQGLSDEKARALLAAALTGPVEERVLEQLVAETEGNPLALLEFSRRPTAGGFVVPGAETVTGTVQEAYRIQVDALPEKTQRFLLLAAADPLGDPTLLWRAADRLAIEPAAGRAAADAGLISLGSRIHFRHPLVRSAVYQRASPEQKRTAHAALAEATDPMLDPERRAWHRAQAADGPDEGLAAELERVADRAQARGGLPAAAVFLERAVALTLDSSQRARRALAAGHAKIHAGAYSSAVEMLAVAEAGPLDDAGLARLERVRAQLAFGTNRGSEAPRLLLKAAQRLEPIDVALSRATYLDAVVAAWLALSVSPSAELQAVAMAAASAPAADDPSPADLLLDALALTFTKGYDAGVPTMQAALLADDSGIPPEQELRWLSLAYRAAAHVWDDDRTLTLSRRYVQRARELGALSELALAVNNNAIVSLLVGDTGSAVAAVEEAYATSEAMPDVFVPFGAMGVAALKGREAEAYTLIEAARGDGARRGEGSGVAGANWADAVINNGLGYHDKAFHSATSAAELTGRGRLGLHNWVLLELIEAAARTDAIETLAAAIDQISEMAAVSRTNWVFGIEALARALASHDDTDAAERHYRHAVECLGATRLKAVLARVHLLFGEWLRRQRRRTEARIELRLAVEMLEAMDMEAFAERARRELRATGETARKRTAAVQTELTPQEAQVARLARDGLSNPEIGSRLYISARTVQYHLSKVFAKLAITSRSQLEGVLP